MKDIAFTGKAWNDFIEWSEKDRKIFEKLALTLPDCATVFIDFKRFFAYFILCNAADDSFALL